GEAVRAALAGGKAATRADAEGRWAVTLPSVAAGGPFVLTIQRSNALTPCEVALYGCCPPVVRQNLICEQ
ncbi:MAG TPA: hypothetical protein VJ801_08255, partial [Polyangia bacterium]|nr:hypothetical protein [Polyangia bacterium]